MRNKNSHACSLSQENECIVGLWHRQWTSERLASCFSATEPTTILTNLKSQLRQESEFAVRDQVCLDVSFNVVAYSWSRLKCWKYIHTTTPLHKCLYTPVHGENKHYFSDLTTCVFSLVRALRSTQEDRIKELNCKATLKYCVLQFFR